MYYDNSQLYTSFKDENRYYLENDEKQLTAEITFTQPNNDLFIIHHTRAREGNKKIISLCPFAKLEFEKKKEYADVWKC
ncbi:GNAT family N-acetyltransferase [Sporosarcina sp. 6E9]|uniref:GNAT family N-acetyltransferase n=1 Tax=Sporosarcina sp. 6E9 TaxID=2819235 RepID=UPI001AC8CC6B|nr:N-acetyltransferase [Sporosarcina sp. 6E9]MBO1911610.1 N-acetyltransferase [Microvirga sp. 3-52]